MAQIFTTVTGLTYSAESTVGENGEVTYRVQRIVQEGAIPVGAIVVHPDYHSQPHTPALINVQFGAGSPEDRHQRSDVPNLGNASTPFVVGHKLVNPLEIATAPRYVLRQLAVAGTATGTSAVAATSRTALRISDLVVALVAEWMGRSDLAELTAKYATFVKSASGPWTEQYAQVKAAEMDALSCQIMSIGERIDQLTTERDNLPPNSGMTSPDVTPDMAPHAQLTGAINALRLKRSELAEALAQFSKS